MIIYNRCDRSPTWEKKTTPADGEKTGCFFSPQKKPKMFAGERCEPIQIFLRSRFRMQIFYVFPRGVNPVGDNCMMIKGSSRRGRRCNGGVLGLCWIDDDHRPPLSLLLASLFGVLVAFVTTGGIVAVWCHRCHRCHCRSCHRRCCCRHHYIVAVTLFDPVTVALATVVATLAVVAAWFS